MGRSGRHHEWVGDDADAAALAGFGDSDEEDSHARGEKEDESGLIHGGVVYQD